MDNVRFEFYIGDTYERNFVIKKYTSDIDEVFFSVKKDDLDKKVLIQKTLDNGITIVEDTIEDDVRKRTYQLLINATDTEVLTPDVEYPFDIEIVTNKENDQLKRTIIKGVVILTSATTRIWNE